MDMILEVFSLGPIETNAILLGCAETSQAAIIDAPLGCAKTVPKRAEKLGLKPQIILLTHSHWDHIADAARLKADLRATLYIHRADAANLEKPGSDGLPLHIAIDGVTPDHFLADGQILKIGNLQVEVIHTPGHTPGGVCLYLKHEKVLIAGDTLFKGGMGNLSLPTARPSAMWQSLKRLAALPPDTRVYPGHGESTTIGAESWIAHAEKTIY